MRQGTGEHGAATRASDFVATDQPLREDVRRLGALVGQMLAEQVSPQFLERVEAIRRRAIARREVGAPIAALRDALQALPVDQADQVVRAFTTWFQATNLAERVHRIRRRRDYQRQDAAPQPGSLKAVVQALREEGVSLPQVAALLPRLRIEPVFTAHPTEAVRRALLEKERTIVRCLVDDIDRTRTPQERRIDDQRIHMALAAAWQTAAAAPERPQVSDELEHVCWYLREVLYEVVPAFYEAFEAALHDAYRVPPDMPAVLRFATWVGSDMDGNPNVGAATIAGTLAVQRALVLEAYQRDVAELAALLTQSTSRVGIDTAVLDRLQAYRQALPSAAQGLRPRHDDMPYRQLLLLMRERLALTAAEAEGGYGDAQAFAADLALVADSLHRNRGDKAGLFAVRRLQRRLDTFGFHLATLDVRQDASVHDAALAALLDDARWPQRPAPERSARLLAILSGRMHVPRANAPEAAATLEVFRTLAMALRRYGPGAIGPCIISMSRSPADVLAVLALARIAGCVGEDGQVPLDVAPLFETVDDLAAAREIMTGLLAERQYRAHLAARGQRQVVMLGYSDSAKDGGLVASRWALQQAQAELAQLGQPWRLRIEFFHGRGGSISRGGGKTERAILAAVPGTVDGVLRVTEQGEVIHRKYGIRALALRNLEQMTGAVLRATLRPRAAEPREARWREMMQDIAARSAAHYRGLVHRHPDFPAYFRAATPIDVIERLRLGSRPARRGGAGDGIAQLRAIPWVFAWSQNRCGLTAWYGVGAGLQRGIELYGLDAMREMTRDWPFFDTLLADVEMVLAKSDMAIFEQYSQLAGRLHPGFHELIRAEFERTCALILRLRGTDRLLAGDRRLRLSIRLRNPYVDPISLLQVDLLRRWREGGRRDEALFQSLVATVNGIAAGVQNTG